jgi:hypothetical protein
MVHVVHPHAVHADEEHAMAHGAVALRDVGFWTLQNPQRGASRAAGAALPLTLTAPAAYIYMR